MRTIGDLIGRIESRQAEIRLSLADGNAASWEIYHRMVGQYSGLKESLEIINDLLKEDDEDE